MRELILVLLLVALAACTAKQSDSVPSAQAPIAPIGSGASAGSGAPAGNEAPIAAVETAVAPEVNPPGDIPDSQAFVKYRSAAGGYALDVPEGWARVENGTDVSYIDKYDGVKVVVVPASAAPTLASARANEARQIAAAGHAVTITDVSELALPSGKVVVIKYTSNSDANAVTGKRVRLENEAILYFKNGKQAMLTLWAPQGADNVDQWNRMSKSFRWL